MALLLASADQVLCAQAQPKNTAAEADAAYQAHNWKTAEKLYEELAKATPSVGRNWYRLGVAAQNAGDHQVALTALNQAKANGAPAMMVAYNLACVRASLGERDEALRNLAEAVKQGYAQPEQMQADSDLQSLRSDAQFAPLVEQAKKNKAPCDYTAENRQFDFWVGQWDVVSTADNIPRGSSHIDRELGNCVIWENWTSLGGAYAGKSYNIYNTSLKRWEQFWVDNAGGLMHFYGNLADGTMDFWTDDIPQPDGSKLKRHLQFFNQGPDKVRQFSQGSKDGGKTWFVEYDFTYNRKKA
jgi:tetratricopeptide (TPR) repeat protein